MARKKKDDATVTGFTRPDLPFDDGEATAAPKAQEGASMEALQARLAELENQLRTQQETNLALMARAPVTPVPNLTPPTVDVKNLPDPVQNPDGYAKELHERTAAALETRLNQAAYVQQMQKVQSDRLEGLWAEFVDVYEPYAQNRKLVEFAAREVVNRAAANGIDTEKYMFIYKDRFMKDVVSELVSLGVKVEEPDEDKDETEETRTDGVLGGLESGSRPNMPTPIDPNDMFADLRQFQLKHGLYK